MAHWCIYIPINQIFSSSTQCPSGPGPLSPFSATSPAPSPSSSPSHPPSPSASSHSTDIISLLTTARWGLNPWILSLMDKCFFGLGIFATNMAKIWLWYRFHILSQNYFSGPVETKLLSESERFSFPWWSTKRRMHGCRHSWCLGFCCHLCKPCDGSHKLEGRMWSLWNGLKSQMDAEPKVDGMGLGLRRISESYYADKWSNNFSNVSCFTQRILCDHSVQT